MTTHYQCSKIAPVRLPEADNFIFFNFFCWWVWDSRHGNWPNFSQSLDRHQPIRHCWWFCKMSDFEQIIRHIAWSSEKKLSINTQTEMSDDFFQHVWWFAQNQQTYRLKFRNNFLWTLYIKSRNYSLVHFTASITMPQAIGCCHVVLPTFDRSCPLLQCARRVNTF